MKEAYFLCAYCIVQSNLACGIPSFGIILPFGIILLLNDFLLHKKNLLVEYFEIEKSSFGILFQRFFQNFSAFLRKNCKKIH